MIRINCDNESERKMLCDSTTYDEDGFASIPRNTRYGAAKGLKPLGDYPKMLVDKDSIKEVIEYCHAEKLFPMYHQSATWMPKGNKWNQNGLPYCWTWGLTASIMDVQAVEGKRNPGDELLAPVSLGFCVNWKSRGNYLESAIQGAIDRGIAPESYVPDLHSRSYKDYREGWEDAALLNRLDPESVWDTDPYDMVRHALSILRLGRPLYIAYDWWGHALECVGLLIDENGKITWVDRNSHNDDDFLLLDGRRAVPSEAYGIHATLNV